jgi:hypothetical protein
VLPRSGVLMSLICQTSRTLHSSRVALGSLRSAEPLRLKTTAENAESVFVSQLPSNPQVNQRFRAADTTAVGPPLNVRRAKSVPLDQPRPQLSRLRTMATSSLNLHN